MSVFDRLHPALQHHVVNTLGWSSLRPFQEECLGPVLDGEHLLVLAPTAGGKTEAAFLPLLSRMLSEPWAGLSVLYVCPLRALLNNLHARLDHYSNLVGRRTGLWHGDVSQTERRRILGEPPDCLLTTPESLEVMLTSPHTDEKRLFSGLRAVVVDEVHAFAGDDRGWHLLAVLERISRLAGREIQRIGLSATVGNAEELLTVSRYPDPRSRGRRFRRHLLRPPRGDHEGDTVEECLDEAQGALAAALEYRVREGLDIPNPSTPAPGQHTVAPPIHTALKAALYQALREANVSKSELARRLDLDEKEARRILDPRHATRLPTMEKALRVLGKHVEVRVW